MVSWLVTELNNQKQLVHHGGKKDQKSISGKDPKAKLLSSPSAKKSERIADKKSREICFFNTNSNFFKWKKLDSFGEVILCDWLMRDAVVVLHSVILCK